jgi:hypothetical protein
MYAYCRNNPIIFLDPSGYNPLLITMGIGAGIGGAIGAGINIYFQAKHEKINWQQVGVATLSGAASGALTGSGIGIYGAIAGNAVIGGGSYAANQLIADESVSKWGLSVNILYGGLSGAYGGAGVYGGKEGIGVALQKVNITAINAAYGQAKSGAFRNSVNRLINITRKQVVVNTGKTVLTGARSNYTDRIRNPFSNPSPAQLKKPIPQTDFGYGMGFA